MRTYDDMAECPVCGEDCNEYYINEDKEIVGCERCITVVDAWEYKQESEYSARIDIAYDELKDRQMGLL